MHAVGFSKHSVNWFRSSLINKTFFSVNLEIAKNIIMTANYIANKILETIEKPGF